MPPKPTPRAEKGNRPVKSTVVELGLVLGLGLGLGAAHRNFIDSDQGFCVPQVWVWSTVVFDWYLGPPRSCRTGDLLLCRVVFEIQICAATKDFSQMSWIAYYHVEFAGHLLVLSKIRSCRHKYRNCVLTMFCFTNF